MKGLSRIAQSPVVLLACVTVSAVGCCHDLTYEDLVDPCWPERYNQVAREEVNTPLAQQSSNGLVLDQTVWNYHFKEGTEQLTNLGMAHLDRLVRRRPAPVPEVYLQTAHDLRVDPKQLEKIGSQRSELNQKRTQVIQNYLAAVRPEAAFHVSVTDPSPVGMSAAETRRIITSMQQSATGNMAIPLGTAESGSTLQQAGSQSGGGGSSGGGQQ